MVHTAYDCVSLLTDIPARVDAVESHCAKLLIACSDGSLRIYAPESCLFDGFSVPDYHRESHELRKEKYMLEKTVSGFSKKPVLLMEVLGSRELLLSLSDSIVFHGLHGLEVVAVISKGKGANVFSWDDKRGLLCFARQKRVLIFRHDGGRGFVEVKDFGVPDLVKSMAWCGENICLGIRKEYLIMNMTNGALTEIFPSGKLVAPLVVSLSPEELLLGKENIGVFVDQNGKLLQPEKICWSEAPSTVVIQRPHAIALLPRRVEIRSLRVPYSLIQTNVLQGIHLLVQSNNVVIAATDNSVYGFFPVPIGAQIVHLTAFGNFEEALALCKLLPPEDSNLRAAKESSIHLRYAHSLFQNGTYEESMEHFFASSVDVTHVLSLYPTIVLPKTSLVPDTENLVDISLDAPYLSRDSSGVSDEMLPSSPTTPSDFEDDGVESQKTNHNTLSALIKYLLKKRYSVIENATVEGTEEFVLGTVGDKFSSDDSGRFKKSSKGHGNFSINSGAREMASILDTALLQALLLTSQSSATIELLKDVNYCDPKICEEILKKGNHFQALLELYKCNSMHREALTLLHQLVENSQGDDFTSIFKPESVIQYLKPLCETDPMLVLEFSMLGIGQCPTETFDLFLSGNIPAELVNSYLKQHAPSMQGKYLELMLAMNESEVSGNLQHEMVQIYLAEVLDWHADLSAQHKWDENFFSLTRKKLLSALENISGYNPETLWKRLPSNALFEEHAILLGRMNQHDLALSLYVHKLHAPELALSYCDRIHEHNTVRKSSEKSINIYLALLQIYLNPKKTLKSYRKQISNLESFRNASVPKLNSAASMKAKGSRATKKIALIEGAEDIRTSHSSTDSSRSDGDADELFCQESSALMLDEVLDLLSKRWDRINGAQALRLLPRETKLQNLSSFLGPLVRKSSETHRNLSVIKSLRLSESLQVKDELCGQRKRVVKIAGETTCSMCHKKIGTSVFAVCPTGLTVAHLVCFRDSSKTLSTPPLSNALPHHKPLN